jgi:hypothetical protein
MTRYIINEEKLCEIYNSQSKTILKRVVKEILSHPYQSERDTCPQNKIWQHCPAAEQIRKQERDKVLDELRPEVYLFALLMEQKLRKHDKERGQTGWHFDGEESEGRRYLLNRLKGEVKELEEAMDDCPPFGSFIGEAVDVGNFAMMISYFDRWADIHYMISEIEKELRQKAGEP